MLYQETRLATSASCGNFDRDSLPVAPDLALSSTRRLVFEIHLLQADAPHSAMMRLTLCQSVGWPTFGGAW